MVKNLIGILVSTLLFACNSSNVHQSQSGQCPQDRTTEMAPAFTASQNNPLTANKENIDAGEELYQQSAKPLACVECHGETGNGNGPMASMFEPSPRNFTCTENVNNLTDGQFFWIIKNGSIGTSMPAFGKLTNQQIWQLTLYIRTLEIKSVPAVMTNDVASSIKQSSL